MTKMIISSFYNALIDEEGAIPVSIMLEIEKIRSQGILFIVGTNRNYQEVLDYNKDFPFIDYIISLNGSYLYDIKHEKCIYKKKIKISDVIKITNIFSRYPIIYYTEDSQYKSLEKVGSRPIYKIEIETSSQKELEEIKKLEVNTSFVELSKKNYLEIVNKDNNMLSAIKRISNKNKVKTDDIITICANDCDYLVIKKIPTSYTIETSSELLKKNSHQTVKNIESILKKYNERV